MWKIISFFYSNLGVAFLPCSDFIGEFFEQDFEVLVVFDDLFDFFHGVGDRSVVFHPKIECDLGHGIWGEISGEIDDDSASIDDIFCPFFGADIGGFDVELFGDDFDNVIDGDVFLFLFDLVFDGVLGKLKCNALIEHVAHGIELDDGAFDFADVVAHVGRDVMDDIVLQLDAVEFAFFFDNGDLGFQAGGLDICHKPPLKSATQSVDKPGDFVGVAVGGDDDLFFGLVELVESMEKLFLGLFLSAQKLYIVDQQKIAFTEMIPEAIHGLGAQVGGEFIHELLKRRVDDVFALEDLLVADGLEEVRFAQPNTTIEEERVVEFARFFRDAFGRGVCELVGAADDETFESKRGVEWGTFDREIFALRWVKGSLLFWLGLADVKLYLGLEAVFYLE